MLDYLQKQPALRVGCDIVEIARIQKILTKYSSHFVRKILTEQEQKKYPTSEHRQASFMAKRFAAKEAFSKAIGTGIGATLHFHDIEVLSYPSGQPYISISPKKLEELEIQSISISLSDERSYAIAMCVVQ